MRKLYRPSVPRSSVADSALALTPRSSASSLSYDQFSQIASYLTQNLGITRASSTSDFTAMSATSGDSTPWIFDSGTTHHMTFDHFVLTNCSLVSDSTYIYTANGSSLAVTQSGNITPTSDLSGRLTLSSVFCISKLIMKLLSIGKLIDNDCNVLLIYTHFLYCSGSHWTTD